MRYTSTETHSCLFSHILSMVFRIEILFFHAALITFYFWWRKKNIVRFGFAKWYGASRVHSILLSEPSVHVQLKFKTRNKSNHFAIKDQNEIRSNDELWIIIWTNQIWFSSKNLNSQWPSSTCARNFYLFYCKHKKHENHCLSVLKW